MYTFTTLLPVYTRCSALAADGLLQKRYELTEDKKRGSDQHTSLLNAAFPEDVKPPGLLQMMYVDKVACAMEKLARDVPVP